MKWKIHESLSIRDKVIIPTINLVDVEIRRPIQIMCKCDIFESNYINRSQTVYRSLEMVMTDEK